MTKKKLLVALLAIVVAAAVMAIIAMINFQEKYVDFSIKSTDNNAKDNIHSFRKNYPRVMVFSGIIKNIDAAENTITVVNKRDDNFHLIVLPETKISQDGNAVDFDSLSNEDSVDLVIRSDYNNGSVIVAEVINVRRDIDDNFINK